MTNPSLPLEHDAANQTYRVELKPGIWGVVTYKQQGKILDLDHSHVPSELQGQGCGKLLVEAVLTDIEASGYKVIPTCSYIAYYIEKHPRWASLLHK